MKMNKTLLTISVASLLAISGCRNAATGTEAGAGESHIAAPNATIDWNTAGTITGTVHYAAKAPPRVEIDMGQDPACGLTGGTNLSEQYLVHDGKLANVFVSITDGLGNKIYAAPATPVVLDQRGCRYVPHVIGVMAGRPVEFTNSDPTMHNVHTTPDNGNPEVNISQPPKAGTMRQIFLHPAAMLRVNCANHPWMQAFINVAPSPFYAVSDADGHFEIRGLPPGTYTLSAVHEELGSQTMQVTVQPKQTASVDFTFSAGSVAAQ
jgi:plastocyanin